ncbi:MAG: gamma-glutamyl-gamma-aminobutyrate hydrolase family protein, partial [Rhodoglobus sp.]
RGAQMLNVALGGTLIQHLPDTLGSTRYREELGQFSGNEAEIDADTKLSALFDGDDTVEIKSHHHQAIDELAPGLVVSARSDDGTIQAVEMPGVPFGVAVQWHPEEGAESDARLFAGIVHAAAEYRASRSRND